MGSRHQHRCSARFGGEVKRRFVEAEEELRTRLSARTQFLAFGGIDADHKLLGAQSVNGIMQMRKRRIGQAAEVDHIGTGGAHGTRAT